MVKQLMGRLTYANVVSTVCLFLILGGAAWAAASLPGDSVGTRQLKDDAVRGAKVAPGSIRASDIGGPVNRAIEARHAADADALGGSGPGAFLPKGAVRSFNEEYFCGEYCSEHVSVLSAAGWEVWADLGQSVGDGTVTCVLSVTRQAPYGRADFLAFVDGQEITRSSGVEGEVHLPPVEIFGNDPAGKQGFGTLYLNGGGLEATVSFRFSLIAGAYYRIDGVVVEPPANG